MSPRLLIIAAGPVAPRAGVVALVLATVRIILDMVDIGTARFELSLASVACALFHLNNFFDFKKIPKNSKKKFKIFFLQYSKHVLWQNRI